MSAPFKIVGNVRHCTGVKIPFYIRGLGAGNDNVEPLEYVFGHCVEGLPEITLAEYIATRNAASTLALIRKYNLPMDDEDIGEIVARAL